LAIRDLERSIQLNRRAGVAIAFCIPRDYVSCEAMGAQQLPTRMMFAGNIKLSSPVARRFHGVVPLIPCGVSIQGEGSSGQDILSRSAASENLKEASIILKKVASTNMGV
jgi:hypothetical protein